MATISELIAKELGESSTSGFDKGKNGIDLGGLPKSIQGLAASLESAADALKKTSEKEESDAEKHQKLVNTLQRRFLADLEELSRVTAALKNSQNSALKSAEEREKRSEALRQRIEERMSRGAGEREVYERQAKTRQGNWLDLIGAVGGKGLQGLVKGFVDARAQTKEDIKKIGESRYKEKVAEADEQKEDAYYTIDDHQKRRTEEIAKTYQKGLSKRVSSEGAEAVPVTNAVAASAELEKAEAESKKKATTEHKKIDVSGRPDVVGQKPQDAVVAGVSPVSERSAEVSKKEAVLGEARKGTAPARAAIAGGELSATVEPSSRLMDTTRSALAAANEGADTDKARATDEATKEKDAAANALVSGDIVPQSEQKSIGMENMLQTVMAPPAVQILGMAMEEFMKLFPVIGQAGKGLVELSGALPALYVTGVSQLVTVWMRAITALKEIFSQSDVSKRYEEESDALQRSTGKTRGESYAEMEARRVRFVKKQGTELKYENSDAGLDNAVAKTSAVKANEPVSYTSGDTSSGASGTSNTAKTSSEAQEQIRSRVAAKNMQGYHPNYAPSVGVVPVGPSNRSIDEWR